jgi:hypothetical protein
VSLILDALRKLEREKEAPGRGFLVMTHVPWARASSGTRLLTLAVAFLTVAVGVLGFALWRRTVPAPSAVTSVLRPTPAPTIAPPEQAPVAAVVAPSPSIVPEPPTPAPSPSPAAQTKAPRAGKPATPRPAPAAEATPAPKKGELHLNAISRQNGQPVALLNDRLVREGDVFDGVRVIHIGESSIEVEVDGRRKTVGF